MEAASDTAGPVAEITHLTRRYRRVTALEDVTLSIPRGGVYGLVGENGAGKTTLIKHLLGLLKAQEGSVFVFALDPAKQSKQVLARIGYLSEDRDLPGWMKVRDLMRYTSMFFPKWDPQYAEELRERFELDPQARMKTLSRGQLAKAGLLAALAHRPEFLVLDEPSSGLDPLVRRDILSAIIRSVAEEGRTVLFSSHLLEEVERVADRVTMLYRGRIVMNTAMETLRDTHHRLVLRSRNGTTHPPQLPGTLSILTDRNEWTYVCEGDIGELKARALEKAELLEVGSPSLEEVFVARAKQGTAKE